MQRIKVGDLVQVVAGRDRGKTGKVQRIYGNKQRVLVEGVNVRVKHQKPTQRNTEGGRISSEVPIHLSNVMLASKYDARAAKRSSS